jgi:hypothetical protein
MVSINPQGKGLPMTKKMTLTSVQTIKYFHSVKIFTDRDFYLEKHHRSSRKDCNHCPLKNTCLGDKVKDKKMDVTLFQKQYNRAYQRQNSSKGEYMKKLRQSTVEPVLGTLLNFLGMRKVNVRGQKGAHKLMLMA